MNKEELARQYADKKTIDCHNSRFGLSNYGLHVKKSYDLFTGYDIEQAFEDGFEKAVELARDYLEEIFGAYCNKDNVIEVFLKTMEGKK